MTKAPHTFRKKWGQNFLRDPNTISKIINCLQTCASDNILEIGPGDGALTDHFSKQTNQVYVVEIDPLLVTNLKNNRYLNVIIHKGDILDWDLNQLKNKVKIIGNLPY
jgi:16S rRNA (adenine1518-N6/adenine1519-N6)-dimethyltransferase